MVHTCVYIDGNNEYNYCVSVHLLFSRAACVTILLNDDPYGVFSFDELSLSTTISEPQGATSPANGKTPGS